MVTGRSRPACWRRLLPDWAHAGSGRPARAPGVQWVTGRSGSPTSNGSRSARASSAPGRTGCTPDLREALTTAGIDAPWQHQVDVAELAHCGTIDGDLHRNRVRQVAGLPHARRPRGAGQPRRGARAGSHRPLPQPDEGARRRPAATDRRSRRRRAAGRHLRRRHTQRGTGVGAQLRERRADQPRHAAPLDAARARPLGVLPAPAAIRRHRRDAPLPRALRRTRRSGHPSTASHCRALRLRPDLRAGVGDGVRPRGHRCSA